MDLQTLKNQYAQEHGYDDWDDLWHAHIHELLDFEMHMNEICIRAQKAALEKAAENAKTIQVWRIYNPNEQSFEVNRKTITNEQNLIR